MTVGKEASYKGRDGEEWAGKVGTGEANYENCFELLEGCLSVREFELNIFY